MIYVGIDPGLSGCIVVLSEDLGYLAHLHMPTVNAGKKNRIAGPSVARFLRDQLEGHSSAHAFLEQVSAMPSRGAIEHPQTGRRTMGAASAFSFGHGAGIIEGLLMGLGIPYTLVTPGSWKTHMKLAGKDKDAARGRAMQLYPGIRDLDLKAKGQALADAIFIVHGGLRAGATDEKKPGQDEPGRAV